MKDTEGLEFLLVICIGIPLTHSQFSLFSFSLSSSFLLFVLPFLSIFFSLSSCFYLSLDLSLYLGLSLSFYFEPLFFTLHCPNSKPKCKFGAFSWLSLGDLFALSLFSSLFELHYEPSSLSFMYLTYYYFPFHIYF